MKRKEPGTPPPHTNKETVKLWLTYPGENGVDDALHEDEGQSEGELLFRRAISASRAARENTR